MDLSSFGGSSEQKKTAKSPLNDVFPAKTAVNSNFQVFNLLLR